MAEPGLNCYAEKSCFQIPDRCFTKSDGKNLDFAQAFIGFFPFRNVFNICKKFNKILKIPSLTGFLVFSNVSYYKLYKLNINGI